MSAKKSHKGWSRRRIFGFGAILVGATPLVRGPTAVAADEGRIRQPARPTTDAFVKRAFEMRDLAVARGDQGYGAIIVHAASGQIVAQSPSRVVTNGDPSAHAEMEAIRDAARRLKSRDLSDYVMYSSTRPCAMCEAAAYWANLNAFYFGGQAAGGKAPRLCGNW